MSTRLSIALSYADAITKELVMATAFEAKHDEIMKWDVGYHTEAACRMLDSLAHHLGYRVERLPAPSSTTGEAA